MTWQSQMEIADCCTKSSRLSWIHCFSPSLIDSSTATLFLKIVRLPLLPLRVRGLAFAADYMQRNLMSALLKRAQEFHLSTCHRGCPPAHHTQCNSSGFKDLCSIYSLSVHTKC